MSGGRPPSSAIETYGGALVLALCLAKAIDAFSAKADLKCIDILSAIEYLRYILTEAIVRGEHRGKNISEGDYWT